MQDTDVTEIWDRLLTTPMQLMTEQERIVHAVHVFLIDFRQGGWLYNASPDESECQQVLGPVARRGRGRRGYRCDRGRGTSHQYCGDC